MIFGISRGFYRLSILAGLIGLTIVLFGIIDHWDDEGSWQAVDYVEAVLIILAPMVLVLVLGWVVAGFHRQNSN